MAKSVMVDGYEFVTNNFAAILDNGSAPVRSQIIIEGGGGGLNMIWVVFNPFSNFEFTVLDVLEILIYKLCKSKNTNNSGKYLY